MPVPRLADQQVVEALSDRIVEAGLVDLVRVLVLDIAPRGLAGLIEELRREIDMPGSRVPLELGGAGRPAARADVDGDRPRHDAPVEGADVQRVDDLFPLGGRPGIEPVVPAPRRRVRSERQDQEDREEREAEGVLGAHIRSLIGLSAAVLDCGHLSTAGD